jgi:hypothetical protein
VATGELHSPDYVGYSTATCDHDGMPIYHAIPNHTMSLVAFVSWIEYLATEIRLKFSQRCLAKRGDYLSLLRHIFSASFQGISSL